MAPRYVALLCCAVSLTANTSHAELSADIRAKINAAFPAWHPNPPENKSEAKGPGTPAPLSDDPLYYLPDYHVKDSPLKGVDPDKMLSERQVQAKAMAAYRNSMTPLEWALNSWHIPLITPSAATRARSEYESAKMAAKYRDLYGSIEAVEKLDPKAAAELRDLLDPTKLPRGN